MKINREKAKQYWPLIKSLQTGLLLITGLAGFMSARCPITNWWIVVAVTGSLFLAISGSTVLNMWYDRDIDAKMARTCWRPLPSGELDPKEAFWIGLVLSILGVGWALMIDVLFGLVVFAGLFFDVVVYTIWLKRRTHWSILWGGISGGMPVLAGRVLAVGKIDLVGIVLALAVLFWIPTHIMTFNMRYHQDYQTAGVPTFASAFGFDFTRKVIAGSSVMASMLMVWGMILIGMGTSYVHVVVACSLMLFFVAVVSMAQPSEKKNFGLFKYASVYMLGSMLLILLQGI